MPTLVTVDTAVVVLAACSTTAARVLDQLCRDGYQEIVVDLTGLDFLGAIGLGVFLRADDQLRATGGRLILHRPARLAREYWRSPNWTPSCPSGPGPGHRLYPTVSNEITLDEGHPDSSDQRRERDINLSGLRLFRDTKSTCTRRPSSTGTPRSTGPVGVLGLVRT